MTPEFFAWIARSKQYSAAPFSPAKVGIAGKFWAANQARAELFSERIRSIAAWSVPAEVTVLPLKDRERGGLVSGPFRLQLPRHRGFPKVLHHREARLVGCGPCPEQDLRHIEPTLLDRELEGRFALVGPGVRVRSFIKKISREFPPAVPGSYVERGGAARVLHVHVGSRGEEGKEDFPQAELQRVHESGPASRLLGVRVRPVFQEKLDRRGLLVRDGEIEGRSLFVVFRVDVDLPVQKHFHDVRLAGVARVHEAGPAFGPGKIGVRAGLEERLEEHVFDVPDAVNQERILADPEVEVDGLFQKPVEFHPVGDAGRKDHFVEDVVPLAFRDREVAEDFPKHDDRQDEDGKEKGAHRGPGAVSEEFRHDGADDIGQKHEKERGIHAERLALIFFRLVNDEDNPKEPAQEHKGKRFPGG